MVVNGDNHALNNYVSSINQNTPISMFESEDAKMDMLEKEMTDSKVGAVSRWAVNPANSHALSSWQTRGNQSPHV